MWMRKRKRVRRKSRLYVVYTLAWEELWNLIGLFGIDLIGCLLALACLD